MTRVKHGNYDETRGLPDNRMQASGNGLDVWLQEQVYQRIGAEQGYKLIEAARAHGTRRYQWLCEQMAARGHGDLAEEYHALQRTAAAKLRLRDKERQLAGWQAQLVSETNEARRAWISKQIKKCEAYIAARSTQ